MTIPGPLLYLDSGSCAILPRSDPGCDPLREMGALAGAVLLYAYHTWTIHRGFATWSELLWDTQDNGGNSKTIARPTWRRLGFWIVLSFVILVSGIALGAIGSAWVAGAG
jgi:hypothetical protein